MPVASRLLDEGGASSRELTACCTLSGLPARRSRRRTRDWVGRSPARDSPCSLIKIAVLDESCNILLARALDQGVDRVDHPEPVPLAATSDLERQIHLDQDRHLLDGLRGLGGVDLAAQPCRFKKLRGGFPAGGVGQCDENLKVGTSALRRPRPLALRCQLDR